MISPELPPINPPPHPATPFSIKNFVRGPNDGPGFTGIIDDHLLELASRHAVLVCGNWVRAAFANVTFDRKPDSSVIVNREASLYQPHPAPPTFRY